MSDVFLGHLKSGAEFCIPRNAFQTHMHLIGGTGKGKTTAIHTMLHPLLRAEWKEIQKGGSEATRILESSRNRLKPYFEAPILQNMFGSAKSHLDVLRFMREGRIVILNLAPRNRLSMQLGDAIGAL